MVEAHLWRPGWKIRPAQFAKAFLKPVISPPVCGLREEPRNARRIAALKIDFANAEAHGAAVFFTEELIFPECRDAIDF